LSRNIIENILDLINGLYEDPGLRKIRMLLTSKITNHLNKFADGIKCTFNNLNYLAFNAWPAFINNKKTPCEIHFYFNPIFVFPKGYLEAGNTWICPTVIHFKACSIDFLSTTIEMKNTEGSMLIVSEIQEEKEKIELHEWKNKYERYCYPGSGYFHQEDKNIDTFSFHLREFYKI
jgi:hypothetical protein